MAEVVTIVAAPAVIVCITIYLIEMAKLRHRERMAKIEQGIDPDAPGTREVRTR
jgi:hypothetical protein